MTKAIKNFPWFEVLLIAALAVALIVKPQTPASASQDAGRVDPIRSVLPRAL